MAENASEWNIDFNHMSFIYNLPKKKLTWKLDASMLSLSADIASD